MERVFREEMPQSHRPCDESDEPKDCRIHTQDQIA